MGIRYAQALLEAATDAVIVIDHAGIIETVNTAAERLFGYAGADMVGRNVDLLMPAEDRERHDGYIRRYLETGDAQVIGRGREVEARRNDGSRFPAGLSVGRIEGTDPPRFVSFIRDLTEQRQALAALQADRDRARDREAEAHRSQARLLAVSRMATMGEMAAGIAHEINQPLTAISNYARACQRFAKNQPPAMEDLQDCMNEIANETQRAAEIIRELRNLVRTRLEERLARDLNEIVRQTRPLILADARVHQTSVHFDTGPMIPLVCAEAVQIQQLLLNLIRNALEALESRTDGKREIRICTCVGADGDVELSVMDNGPGIDPTVEQEMFEPFVSTKPSGTGLGLAISRTIAQNHGGQLLVRSSDVGGACFTLRLPRYTETTVR
jgi:two-component system, LuxR family, sensor kinase FixL